MRRQAINCAARASLISKQQNQQKVASLLKVSRAATYSSCALTSPKLVLNQKQQQQVTASLFSTQQYKSYHTTTTTPNYNNSSATSEENTLKVELLKNALQQVHSYGWSIDALNSAAKELNLSTMAVSQLLPNAELELIEYFITKCNQHMSRTIQLMDTSSMHPKDIIKLAIRTRLEMVAPYVQSGTWPQAMSSFIFGKHPLNFVSQAFYHLTSSASTGGSSSNMSKNSITGLNAMYHLAILADEICFLTGVRDTDIDWYAKRGAVATVYASTEFYMLTDKSEGFSETWRFLENRMEEAASVKSLTDNLFQEVQFWAKGFESMWGMNKGPSTPHKL